MEYLSIFISFGWNFLIKKIPTFSLTIKFKISPVAKQRPCSYLLNMRQTTIPTYTYDEGCEKSMCRECFKRMLSMFL